MKQLYCLIAIWWLLPFDANSQVYPNSMVKGLAGWSCKPLFSVGESYGDHYPVGILDGIGARRSGELVEVFVNHENSHHTGRPYSLANGLELKGARITRFVIEPATQQIAAASNAYDRIIDRRGQVVQNVAQLCAGQEVQGVSKLCSSTLAMQGSHGLVDDVYLTGEEMYDGQAFALAVDERTLYTVPFLGRAAFENVVPVGPPDEHSVALLLGDDTPQAPLYLYIGKKDHYGDGSFLDRNGFAHGRLYVLVMDDGSTSPQDFHGTGSTLPATFQEIAHYRPELSGIDGYDPEGFAYQYVQYGLGQQAGMFRFSRPEDLHTDPADPSRVVLASTGRGEVFPADDWGAVYVIDLDIGQLSAQVTILYDGDDAGGGQFPTPDHGLRNPDNLTWSANGYIYVQEDRSTMLTPFGSISGIEASIWQLDPGTGAAQRIAMIDRTGVLPSGQYDNSPQDLGNWETSGILDVSEVFQAPAGETWLLADVQAHSVRGGAIADQELVEGGQLFLLRTSTDGSIVADEKPGDPSSLLIYPIPVQQWLNFEIADGYDQAQVTVLDLQGRRVRMEPRMIMANGKGSIDVSGLANGLYVLEISWGDKVHSGRFTKAGEN